MSVPTSPIDGSEWQIPRSVDSRVAFSINKVKHQLSMSNGQVVCKRVGLLSRLMDEGRRFTGLQIPFVGIQREADRSVKLEAGGSAAITNALSFAYGDDTCRQMLAWLHRGIVLISANCTAASFVPRSSHKSDVVVNQGLGYEICRQMVFGRRGHELFWLPGEGLPCFRIRDCPNGTYKVTEVDNLPPGVELCKAELGKDFG